ncbi:MAG: EamA family transporter [Pedosphaera sp.]|nr:EamA family transporter [Pedosphaera sp.]
MLAAVLAMVLFATSSVTARRSVARLGPASANFWRILTATVALAVFSHGWGRGLGGVGWGWYVVSGLVGYGIGDFGIFRALPLLGARLSSLMTQCLAAPLAAAFEWCWRGTILSTGELVAGGVILSGVALALSGGENRRVDGSPRRIPGWGIVFGILGAAGQAGGAVLSRHGMHVAENGGALVGGYANGLSVAYQRILPGLAFGAAWWLLDLARSSPVRISKNMPFDRRALPWVVANGLVGPFLGVGFYQQALHDLPTGVVMSIVALTPLAVIPLSMLIEKEHPSRWSVLGGVIAVAGATYLVGGFRALAQWGAGFPP